MAGCAGRAELETLAALTPRLTPLASSQPTPLAMADLAFLFGFWVAVLVTADLVIRTVVGLAGGLLGAITGAIVRRWRRAAA